MSPELAFILSLALRMAVAAAFVVIASFITERSGPAIGALVATLPVSGGPSYVFLALDHDDAFIAQSALASLPMNAATMLMSLVFVIWCSTRTRRSLAARHRGLVRAAALVRAFEWTLAAGIVLNVVVFGDLPAAGAALSQRQDAAGHPPLVRHSAARRAGRDPRRRRGDAVEHGRPAGSAASSRCFRPCSRASS